MKVLTFGEIMLRLKSPGHERLFQSPSLEASFGGGEANVAVSLAKYGLDAAFVTKLPENPIGEAAIRELRKYGVDVGGISTGGSRIGIYYLEKGASQRPSKVVYDRAHSAIGESCRDDFDWNEIFKDAGWFHFTGITPALGPNVAEICKDAVKEAKKRNITVSCDLNYRKKLWSRKEAERVMHTLMPYVDVCISNEEDADDVFGIKAENTDIEKGNLNKDGYISVARQLSERFGLKKVAITLRGSISASDNNWSGMLYENGKAFFAPNYNVHIVDRVGGGDSFGGGLIYALLQNWDNQRVINFAVAASCLKHTIEHDFNLMSVAEVEALAAGNASGRVQR